ncbi:MAG: class I SAM-dependent methyltransferase [Deltaproteobacteria bacterium]|nr:class I SAM-dependent methyltransferase [Candidatus Zymogenaceae bacterium]
MDSIREYNEEYWEERNEIPAFEKQKFQALVKYVPSSVETIVDYGCGAGQYIRAMKKINEKGIYIGIDISQKALDLAASHLTDVQLLQVDDGARIPLENDSVDFIVASEVLEHVYHVSKTLNELWRILKPDGKMWLSVPFHGIIKNLLIALMNFDEHYDPLGPHIRFFTKKTLFDVVTDSGFEIIRHGYWGRFYPIPWNIHVYARKS